MGISMKLNPVINTTSSRLDRETELSPAAEAQEDAIIAITIGYCNKSLDNSRFFSKLKDGVITPSLMQYTFLQYYFWRDQLHKWFALCIIKAQSCSDPDQKRAIMSLSDHIFTDLQDGHDDMYIEFLHDIGLSDAEIKASNRSLATISYERSFFDDFGYETENFYETLAALSGRELCVSLRNVRILQYYFDARNQKQPTWLSLHAELEIEHFRDAIRPVITRYYDDSVKIDSLMKAVERGIDRHIQYFEDILHEYESLPVGLHNI
jgi:pyrroloquinoline quinone (PQQ) biosynthesis protein C